VKEASIALEDEGMLREFIKEKATIAVERFLDYLPKMSIPVEKRDLGEGWTLTCRGADGGDLSLTELIIKVRCLFETLSSFLRVSEVYNINKSKFSFAIFLNICISVHKKQRENLTCQGMFHVICYVLYLVCNNLFPNDSQHYFVCLSFVLLQLWEGTLSSFLRSQARVI
jgi:hypothetical protein